MVEVGGGGGRGAVVVNMWDQIDSHGAGSSPINIPRYSSHVPILRLLIRLTSTEFRFRKLKIIFSYIWILFTSMC